MALITRQGKGSELSINEMDNDLLYLENLVLSDNSFSEINDLSSPINIADAATQKINITEKTDIQFVCEDAKVGNYKLLLNYEEKSDISFGENIEWVNYGNYSYPDFTYDKPYGFDCGNGVNGDDISCMSKQGDKLLIGGYFSQYNYNTCKCIARINFDGSFDDTFNIGGVGFNSTSRTYNILTQTDGKILISGIFTSYNGVTCNYLARLNSNGELDEASIGSFNSNVYSISIYDDGRILASGGFTLSGTNSCNSIARLNSDGSFDDTFISGTGLDNNARKIIIIGDGRILIGGYFTTYNGNSCNRIARLNSDGSFDNSFDIGTGFNSVVKDIVELAGGKILVGGEFTTYNGNPCGKIVRLNSDGSIDNTFDCILTDAISKIRINDNKIIVGAGSGVYILLEDGSIDPEFLYNYKNIWDVYSIELIMDKIFAGGEFNLLYRKGITRLNSNGTIDTPIATDQSFNLGAGFNDYCFKTIKQNDNKIVAIGGFTSYNGITSSRIARLNSDGTYDNTYNIGDGFDRDTLHISIQPDDKIIIGGSLNTYNGLTCSNLIRLNVDGSIDKSFDIFYTGGSIGIITALLVTDDDKIIANGEDLTSSGFSRLVALNSDGTIYKPFRLSDDARGIAKQKDGKIIITGDFDSISSNSEDLYYVSHVARLNQDLSIDTTFGNITGFTGAFFNWSIDFQSDGKIIIGSEFSSFNGISCNNILRLNVDGTFDSTFNIGTGFVGPVKSLYVMHDDRIIVSGDFTSFNDISCNKTIILNQDGTLYIDLSWIYFDKYATSIIKYDDRHYIFSGDFTDNSGWSGNGMIKMTIEKQPLIKCNQIIDFFYDGTTLIAK